MGSIGSVKKQKPNGGENARVYEYAARQKRTAEQDNRPEPDRILSGPLGDPLHPMPRGINGNDSDYLEAFHPVFTRSL